MQNYYYSYSRDLYKLLSTYRNMFLFHVGPLPKYVHNLLPLQSDLYLDIWSFALQSDLYLYIYRFALSLSSVCALSFAHALYIILIDVRGCLYYTYVYACSPWYTYSHALSSALLYQLLPALCYQFVTYMTLFAICLWMYMLSMFDFDRDLSVYPLPYHISLYNI